VIGGYWPVPVPPLEELQQTEFSDAFLAAVRNRLILGAFRYGTQEQQAKKRIDRTGSLQRRLDDYVLTGNLEHLVDFAAIAMAEFIHPGHPAAHWLPSDDGEHASITEV
jgi:hypothetical protein